MASTCRRPCVIVEGMVQWEYETTFQEDESTVSREHEEFTTLYGQVYSPVLFGLLTCSFAYTCFCYFHGWYVVA